MYIHRITLKDIRGFRELNFDLKRSDPESPYAGWTVFTGDNGSGKSTLLKAVAMALVGPDTARPLQPNLERWVNASSKDKTGSIQLEIIAAEDDTSLVGGGRSPKKPFNVMLKLINGGKQTELHSASLAGRTKKTPERTIWSPNSTGWFSCGYGPFRRVFGASAEATEIMVTRSTAPYATMFQEAASLATSDRWLKDLDHKASKDPSSRERAERDLLLEFLEDELMPNGMRIQRVDADGLWLKDRDGVELSWSEMSDGYRAALALLTDILRHLRNAHDDGGLPSLLDRDAQGKLFVKCSGVVLIDEIDAHLHPEWQREIGFWLKRHFPRIQFLVTSHSPIICQAADPNGLFHLPEPASGKEPQAMSEADYHKIIASRPDTILLTPAFGLENTRSPRAVAARAEYARLDVKKRSTHSLSPEEERRMQQLELFVNTDEEP